MSKLGETELDVFPLVLGGNTFGWTSDEATSHRVLDAFTAAGGNVVDTSDNYSAFAPGNSGGESETVIGAWLRTRRTRDDVVLATKVSLHPEFPGLSASNVAAAADASLTRLRTDRIDVYFAHVDDPDTPLTETAAAFDALVTAGKIREIGLSNYSASRIEEWFEIARREGFRPPSVLQPHYNLVHRAEYERELAPVVRKENLAVLPYFGLASGFLTGKYRTREDVAGKPREGFVGRYFSDAGLDVVRALLDIASTYGVEAAAVALAWLRHRPEVAAPIASVREVAQLPALMASATLRLSGAELAALDDISSRIDG